MIDDLYSGYIYDVVICCCYDRIPQARDTRNKQGFWTHGSGGLEVQGHGTNLVRASVFPQNTAEGTCDIRN